MSKINLLRRRLAKQTKVSTSMSGVEVWTIAKDVDDRRYYIHDMDIKNGCLLWTSDRDQAIEFFTQTAVDMFIHANINNRKGVYVVVGNKQIEHIVVATGKS